MTKARIQLFRKAHNKNRGCFNGRLVYPRSVTEKIKAFYLYKNQS